MATKHRTIIGYPLKNLQSLSPHSAFSLRNLRATPGSVIQVRRSSDNTNMDIGTDSNGDLDETALLAFVGAGSGFIRQWYDQSGNGRTLIQTNLASQPRIVNAGVVDKVNGRPCLVFDGVNDRLVSGQAKSVYNFIHNGGLAATFCVFKSGNSANPNRISYILTTAQNTNGAGHILFHSHVNSGAQNSLNSRTYRAVTSTNSSASTATTFPPNVQHLGVNYIDANDATVADRNYLYKNNEEIQDSNAINLSVSASNCQATFEIGSRVNLDSFFLGQIQEVILFNSHPNRATVVNNINSYFNIV